MSADRYENAVKLPNGDVENFTIRLDGKKYHCHCGCNCFHKPEKNRLDIFRCNACGETFETD